VSTETVKQQGIERISAVRFELTTREAAAPPTVRTCCTRPTPILLTPELDYRPLLERLSRLNIKKLDVFVWYFRCALVHPCKQAIMNHA
jgi:hypothetical protein